MFFSKKSGNKKDTKCHFKDDADDRYEPEYWDLFALLGDIYRFICGVITALAMLAAEKLQKRHPSCASAIERFFNPGCDY